MRKASKQDTTTPAKEAPKAKAKAKKPVLTQTQATFLTKVLLLTNKGPETTPTTLRAVADALLISTSAARAMMTKLVATKHVSYSHSGKRGPMNPGKLKLTAKGTASATRA